VEQQEQRAVPPPGGAMASHPALASSMEGLLVPAASIMGQCRDFALTGSVVAILGSCASLIPLGKEKYSFVKEFFGMFFIVGFTFTPGKWVGTEAWWHSWMWHGAGIIAADLLCGGGHVNPSMSYALYAVGYVTYG